MVGARLAWWREAKGISREDLAEHCDVTAAAVHQWEKGLKRRGKLRRVSPSLKHLEKAVELFGVTMEEFYAADLRRKRAA